LCYPGGGRCRAGEKLIYKNEGLETSPKPNGVSSLLAVSPNGGGDAGASNRRLQQQNEKKGENPDRPSFHKEHPKRPTSRGERKKGDRNLEKGDDRKVKPNKGGDACAFERGSSGTRTREQPGVRPPEIATNHWASRGAQRKRRNKVNRERGERKGGGTSTRDKWKKGPINVKGAFQIRKSAGILTMKLVCKGASGRGRDRS